jgi:hypothetical protein
MGSLFVWLAIDALSLGGCIFSLRRRLSFFHPAFYYLFFHLYVITIPAWQIYFGGSVMYEGMRGHMAITPDEFARAIAYADLALAMFSVGTLLGPRIAFARKARPRGTGYVLSGRLTILLLAILLPFSLYFFAVTRSSLDAQSLLVASGYGATFALWPFACLIMGLFRFGFRWFLVAPLAILLMIVGLQGYHRFMFVLTLLFMASVYLYRTGRRWPPAWAWPMAITIVLVFPQLKYIGRAVHEDDLSGAARRVEQALFLAPPDTELIIEKELLDPYAGALTLTDTLGKRYFGSTYLPLLTFPIPRFLWPDKPGFGDHVIAMATRSRPYEREGRTITYIAEAYLNFGIAGVILVPLVLGAVLNRAYRIFRSGPPGRIGQLFYLSIMMSLILAYRDGLMSFVVFGIINMFPIVIAWALQIMTQRGKYKFSLTPVRQ